MVDVYFLVWSLSRLLCRAGSVSNVAAALRRMSAAARLLRLGVRIPPGAWMFVCCECCLLSGRGLCDELIMRPEESYRLWRVVGCDLRTSRMRRPWPEFIGRSLVRSQLVSLEFFIYIKSFRSHYGPGVDSASNRSEYQEHFLGVKAAGA